MSINRDRVTNTFLDLAKINSPSKNERKAVDYAKEKLISLGFSVEEDNAGEKIGGNAGNIIAFKRGSAPDAKAIFLSCHLDTVEPTESLKIIQDGAIISSDGTTILGADDKAGAAAVLEAVESISEDSFPHGDLQVIFSVSEEIGLLGARALDRTRIKADLGYIFDTEKPVAGITVSAPSHETMTIEIIGRAAHAGIAPEKGVSAIIAASRAISKMKLGRIDSETTANVGVIEGGKARNIIPEFVAIKAEARSRDEDKLKAQIDHMLHMFEIEAAAVGARVNVKS